MSAECVCDPGWTGQSCEFPVIECSGHGTRVPTLDPPCVCEEVCVRGVVVMLCDVLCCVVQGWTGRECDVEVMPAMVTECIPNSGEPYPYPYRSCVTHNVVLWLCCGCVVLWLWLWLCCVVVVVVVVLCCVVLCCVVLCCGCVVLCCVVLCYVVLCHVTGYCPTSFSRAWNYACQEPCQCPPTTTNNTTPSSSPSLATSMCDQCCLNTGSVVSPQCYAVPPSMLWSRDWECV